MLNHQLTERSRFMRLAPLGATWKESQSGSHGASMFWLPNFSNLEILDFGYCTSRCSCDTFPNRCWSTRHGKVAHLWCSLRSVLDPHEIKPVHYSVSNPEVALTCFAIQSNSTMYIKVVSPLKTRKLRSVTSLFCNSVENPNLIHNLIPDQHSCKDFYCVEALTVLLLTLQNPDCYSF